ncbi:MAG TPA: hypothetical protein VMT64_00715 [Candidatus Binataceae bacterium]|nr:hypothetical protein [Candidatus Binataceae bacterium]
MKMLTIIAWIVDSLVLLYFAQLLARMGLNWSGGFTILTLAGLVAASMIISAVLVSISKERWARRAALVIAGTLPLIGGLAFLAVGLIAAVAILTGARWN